MPKLTFNREPKPIPKKLLRKGEYYVGTCRNAQIARWDGEKFHHWRSKWGNMFVETIKHREDDEVFDVFDAWQRINNELVVKPIPFEDAELISPVYTTITCPKCGHKWGAYEDNCHCDGGECHNKEVCEETNGN